MTETSVEETIQPRNKRNKFKNMSAAEQSEFDSIRRKNTFYNVGDAVSNIIRKITFDFVQRGKTDPEKLKSLIERSEMLLMMPQGIGEDDLFNKNEKGDLSIDDIFIKHAMKVDQQL